ncbi:hypothetical protein XI00_06590 [Bradyrhizobium sp. CCBAU 21359]|nr:hypothetical protein [Bradyrhizobium sp. CCBAU 21359]
MPTQRTILVSTNEIGIGIGVLDQRPFKDARAQALCRNHLEIIKRIVTALLIILVLPLGVVDTRRSSVDHQVAQPKRKSQSIIVESISAVLPDRIDDCLGRAALNPRKLHPTP